MNTKDITLEGWHEMCLLYGPPGTGKTHFLKGMPKPCYVFDFDGGVMTLRGEDIEYDTFFDKIEAGKGNQADKIRGSAAEEVYSTLSSWQGPGNCPYASIALDSISTFQESLKNWELKTTGRPKATLAEWGNVMERLTKLFTLLKNIEAHKVVTAHELLIQDETSGLLVFKPLVVGKKLPNKMPLYFDEVYRLFIKDNGEHWMHTKAGRNFDAKSRLGLPKEMPADFNKVLEEVSKAKKGGK